MKRSGSFCLSLLWAMAAPSCGDDSLPPAETLEIPEGCNPIGARQSGLGDCLLPYPSDYYRVDRGAGPRVELSQAASLAFDGQTQDVLAFHRPDGFSVGSPILAHLEGPIDDGALVTWHKEIERSLSGDSPTLLLDAETGSPVLHFAELDPRAPTPDRQALIIRPLVRLEAAHRYVVGIRTLTNKDTGAKVPAPDGFRSLRDDGGAANPLIEDIAGHYEKNIFPLLDASGTPRADWTLAWDFTTRTDEDATGDMLAMRDDLLARLSASPPAVEVIDVEDDVDEHTARKIELIMSVPLYLSSPEPGGTLNGSPPAAETVAEVPVTIWVPRSVAERAPGAPPARLLHYGHGFFGSREEANGLPAELADQYGFVVAAIDWWGLSEADQGFVAGEVVTNPANMMVFTDRLQQAFANNLALDEALAGPIATLAELDVGGTPAYDPDVVYFYGISMGHILGATFVTLSPRVERAVLEVGGANFSLMLFRARPFLPLLALLQTQLDDPLDQQKFGALAQSAFDRVDPLSYAPLMFASPLDGAPPDRTLLIHTGVADSEVPNVASYFFARIIGVPVLEEAASFIPAGLEAVSSPAGESALTLFDFGIAPTLTAEPPAEGTPVHEGLRRLEASKLQVSDFLRAGGVIENPCRATCDPE